MQHTTAIAKLSRTIILTLALLLSIGFGTVAAESNGPALTECDSHGCAVAYASGNAGRAEFSGVSVREWHRAYISGGPMEMGLIQ